MYSMTLAQCSYGKTLTMRGWIGAARTAVGASHCHIFTMASSQQGG